MTSDSDHPSLMAHAKINLGLRVTGKRSDGYHELCTIFHRIGLFDDIVLRRSSEITVETTDRAAPSDASNICHIAARMIRERLAVEAGVHISIAKRIPIGAGLGGGSADAALVLKELPSFWGKALSREELHAVALQLGSDVPYFLQRGSAYARGRGEILEYIGLDVPYAILLCTPNIAVSTAWAYGQVRPHPEAGRHLLTIVREGMRAPQVLREELVNDFEEPVFAAYPAIGEVKHTMLTHGAAYASMSGSGSSVFGLFPDIGGAQDAATHFVSRGYRCFLTPPHFTA